MSDMIKRDDVLAIIADLKKDYPTHSVPDAEAKVALRKVAEKIRTIDAVEVVRCKDCEYIFFDDWYKCFSCANLYGLNEEVKPNDFCSHGERNESER